MKIHPDDFRVAEGKNVHLGKWPTRIKPVPGRAAAKPRAAVAGGLWCDRY